MAALVCLALPHLCCAGELAGKLERVDRATVTLRGQDNSRLVLKADNTARQKAAPFLGKSVTVQFRNENGHKRVVVFRSMR